MTYQMLYNSIVLSHNCDVIFEGLATVPPGAAGMLMGGYIVKRFNLKLHGILNFNIACNFIVFLSTATFLVRCDSIRLAGVINSYDGTEIEAHSTTYFCSPI